MPAFARLTDILAPFLAEYPFEITTLLSGSGIIGTRATAEMIELVEQAIQIGYTAALKDVENGDLDDDILQWRPDLTDG